MRQSPAWLPYSLVALSLVPVISGIARLSLIASGNAPTPDETRFLVSPAPVAIHILASSSFSLVGAFQFSSRHRRQNTWHRVAGCLLVPCGLATACSGLWMTLFYPWGPGDGVIVYLLRLAFGGAMALSIVLAVAALKHRDFRRHGAWMIRAYAIALGAGTQVFTHLPWVLIIGEPGTAARAWLMSAGWMINVAVAEWIIWRSSMTRQSERIVSR